MLLKSHYVFLREFLDRQEGAVSDGYTKSQFVDMLMKMLEDAAVHHQAGARSKVYDDLSIRWSAIALSESPKNPLTYFYRVLWYA
jgi:hypothetical protein